MPLDLLVNSVLGKKTDYDSYYRPDHLFPIPRVAKREEIGIKPDALPFVGFDYWNHYEVSWLNERGKPVVAMAEIYYDCSSPHMIESKSLKLYFNSLNNSKFNSYADVADTIKSDLSSLVGAEVSVTIKPLGHSSIPPLSEKLNGQCLDDLDIECSNYTVNPDYLSTEAEQVEECLYSDLLKSNCLVTGQPDWASVQITYTGNKINHAGLLRYLVSFRNHNEFHEQCIERIFVDIMRRCQPSELSVYGRYTRRGGLDINPYRSTRATDPSTMNYRLPRQ